MISPPESLETNSMQEFTSKKVFMKKVAFFACCSALVILPGCSLLGNKGINTNNVGCNITPKLPNCSISMARAYTDKWSKINNINDKERLLMTWKAYIPSGSVGYVALERKSFYARYKYFNHGYSLNAKVHFELRFTPDMYDDNISDVYMKGKICDSNNTIAITFAGASPMFHFVECTEFSKTMRPLNGEKSATSMLNTWIYFATSTINMTKAMLKNPIYICFKDSDTPCMKGEFLYDTN